MRDHTKTSQDKCRGCR